jgi:riboflavin kinase/FMN adenylyltransferase
MLHFKSLGEVPKEFSASAITIGKFDALHLGHQHLLSELKRIAGEKQLASVVVTFDKHPLNVLHPGSAPQSIIGPEQKIAHIDAFGVDALVTLEFDDLLAKLSPEEFVKNVLVERLHAKFVVVGHSFRFGANGEGDCSLLAELAQKYGFEFKEVEKLEVDGAVVSATSVRQLLDRGDVVGAAKLLGRPHVTTGEVEHGLKIGRTIGFPTANISRDCEGYLPLDGVYAGWMHVDGEKMPTAISIGINETFQAVPRLAEAFVLDRKDLDLYGKTVDLEYVGFVRPAAKFNGVEDLVISINNDIAKIRVLLGIGAGN